MNETSPNDDPDASGPGNGTTDSVSHTDPKPPGETGSTRGEVGTDEEDALADQMSEASFPASDPPSTSFSAGPPA